MILGKSRIVWLLLIALCDIAAAGSDKKEKARYPKHLSTEPFASFKLLDVRLTEIDREFRKFKEEADQGSKTLQSTKKRTALRTLHSSKSLRELRSSVSNLHKVTVRLRSRYRSSGHRYGQRIFNMLDRKALTLRGRLESLSRAPTWSATRFRERQFDKALVSFVLQYQGISGGYVALACSPGDWTCCQPKKVQLKGTTPLNGCTWLCTNKIRSCRLGCLGPRAPTNAGDRAELFSGDRP